MAALERLPAEGRDRRERHAVLAAYHGSAHTEVRQYQETDGGEADQERSEGVDIQLDARLGETLHDQHAREARKVVR